MLFVHDRTRSLFAAFLDGDHHATSSTSSHDLADLGTRTDSGFSLPTLWLKFDMQNADPDRRESQVP